MGVKNLLPFLKKKAPEAFFTIPLKYFARRRIAVDANNWMITHYSKIRAGLIRETNDALREPDPQELHRRWFRSALQFILKLIEQNIIPIFVFDGQHPDDKSSTKKKRQEDRQKRKNKIDNSLEQLANMDPLDRQVFDTSQIIRDQMNYVALNSNDYVQFRKFLTNVGMIVLKAEGEAEKLCCSLCIEGKVSAVYSADSDTLVYGCPLVMTGISFDRTSRQNVAEIIRYDRVLQQLNLSPAMFTDFCIMCGTDYNDNIESYGVHKSYGLIQKHFSIDRLPLTLDLTVLRHQRCRELFSYQESQQLVKEPITFEHQIDPEAMEQAVSFVGQLGNDSINSDYLIGKLQTISCEEGYPPLGLCLYPPYRCSGSELIFYF